MTIAQPATPEQACDLPVAPIPDLSGWEQTFGSSVTLSTDSPVTVGVDDLVCHVHDRRQAPPQWDGEWWNVTYVTRLDGRRRVLVCGRDLPAFLWQCSRDGAVNARPAALNDRSTAGRVA